MLSKEECEKRLDERRAWTWNQCLAGQFGPHPREQEALQTALALYDRLALAKAWCQDGRGMDNDCRHDASTAASGFRCTDYKRCPLTREA